MINRTLLKYALIGVAVGTLTLLLFGIPTTLVPTPFFTRMIPPTLWDYGLLVATSLLLGTALHLYGRQRARGEKVAAYGGALGGILSFGCPICNKLLVAALGASTVMTYVNPYRPLFGALTLGLLGSAIYFKARGLRACPTCPADEAAIEDERKEKR